VKSFSAAKLLQEAELVSNSHFVAFSASVICRLNATCRSVLGQQIHGLLKKVTE
jgi:hypothetical protein